jgi:E3 ubiquitin-protein ligase SHPRH
LKRGSCILFQVYDESLESALLQLNLDARGVATSQNQEVDTALLRTWLRKLRQICTHPQVGQLQRPGDKFYKPGVLKSMGQVLEGMRDQNWRNFMDDRRNKARVELEFPPYSSLINAPYLDRRDDQHLTDNAV